MRDAFRLGWMRNSERRRRNGVRGVRGKEGQMDDDPLTMLGKVKEWRHSATTWQLQVSLAQLVEERVRTSLQRTDSSTGRVLQQTGDECDRLWRGARSEHLEWGLGSAQGARERERERD